MHTFIVRVKPGNVVDEVIPDGDEFVVKVKSPAVDGRANRDVIRLLANYFKLKPRQVLVMKGEKSRVKTISILS